MGKQICVVLISKIQETPNAFDLKCSITMVIEWSNDMGVE